MSPKIKYMIRYIVLVVILAASLILSVPAGAKENTPPQSVEGIWSGDFCGLPGSYAPDYVVKGGEVVDRERNGENDLYTRHFVCDRSTEEIPVQVLVKKHHNHSSTTTTTTTTVTPTPKPQLPPVPNPTKKPAKSCHNKNDAKDGKIGDCDAGKGNNDKDK